MPAKKNLKETLSNLCHRVLMIFKEDTLEIYEKYLKPKKQRAQYGKRVNVWVGILLVVASSLGIYIIFPLFAGMIANIFKEASSDNVAAPSSEAIISFIAISAALGVLIMWFTKTSSANAEKASNRMIKFAAQCFLLSALSLALFMLLSPILPTIKESTDLYEMTIKTVALLSFIGGSISFIMADVIGLLYIMGAIIGVIKTD